MLRLFDEESSLGEVDDTACEDKYDSLDENEGEEISGGKVNGVVDAEVGEEISLPSDCGVLARRGFERRERTFPSSFTLFSDQIYTYIYMYVKDNEIQ